MPSAAVKVNPNTFSLLFPTAAQFANSNGLAMSGISAYVAKAGTYTTLSTDGTVNCTSGSFTVTLLTAAGNTGLTQTIKNSGAGTITVNTTSSQTIDGSLTKTLVAKQSITVQSDGANWIII